MRPSLSALAMTGAMVGVLLVACVGEDPQSTPPAPDGGTSSSSGNASSSGGSTDGAAEACKDTCSGQCVDLQTDPANCGGCGQVCTGAKVKSCVAGKCGNEIVKVSMGTYSACLVLRDGTVWCWGSRDTGTTGEPASAIATPIPTMVGGLSKIVDVSVGHEHACAIDSSGDVWCWGHNGYEQTGSASTAADCTGPSNAYCHVPRKVPLAVKAAQISAGAQTNCIRTVGASGDVYCWGRNASRIISVSDNDSSDDKKPPTKISTFTGDVVDLSLSMDDNSGSGPRVHACAVRTSGQVWCWGANILGELGHPGGTASCPRGAGTLFCEPTPKAAVVGGTSTPFADVSSVRTLIDATCVVKNDKSVWCWGSRQGGQTGVGLDGGAHPEPAQVGGLDPAAQFDARGYNAWVVAANGDVKGWGVTDYWNVGVNSTGNAAGCLGNLKCFDTPTPVAGLQGVNQLGGGLHSAAALRGGVVLAWGRNTYAELGHAANTSDDAKCPGTYAGGDFCNPTPKAVGELP